MQILAPSINDVIYRDHLWTNYQMNLLESTQYQATLAVSGAWKGTSRTKIYDELG